MELESETITLDVQLEAQDLQELHGFGRTHYTPIKYRLLIKAKNNKFLIINKPISYLKEISNINSKKKLKAMKYKMDSIYSN